MSKKFIVCCAVAVLFFCVAGGCIRYTSVKAIQMELPAIGEGEKIIRYSVEEGGKQRCVYTVSYDVKNKQPYWVAYDLTSEELVGNAKRRRFIQDLNANVPQAADDDYRGSGWTRGHLAPVADFKWSEEAMEDICFYTNCCPQIEYFNGTSWERLERRVRDWAKRFGRVYIVTGPIIGEAVNGTIGHNRITVPDAFFKAILTKNGDSYEAVGFIMENTSSPQPYTKCCVSIDVIERVTGLDLFHNLDDEVERRVESSYNIRFWGM